MRKWHKSTLFKIIAPILFIGVAAIWISETLIGEIIVRQVSKSASSELEASIYRVYGAAKSRYEVLFANHAANPTEFRAMEPLVKQEAIRDIQNVCKNNRATIYLYNGQEYLKLSEGGKNIDFSGAIKWDENGHIGQNIYASKQFLPWGWRFIAVYEDAKLEAVISTNKRAIAVIIIAMVLLIAIAMVFMLYRAINVPFQRIFAHLDKIQNGEYEQLAIDKKAAGEIKSLTRHINDMTNSLKERKEESEHLIDRLLKEKRYTKTILDSQTSIVIVTNGKELLNCNKPFFDFFDTYEDIEQFKVSQRCICAFFESYDDGEQRYIEPNEENWVQKAIGLEQKAMMRKNGRERHFGVNAKRHEQDGEILYIVTLDDITPLVSQKNELKKRLYTDTLTGLPNRRQLLKDITDAESPVLMLINIDSFSQINDLYGYKTGDELIVQLGKKLLRAISLIILGYKFEKASQGWRLYKLASDEYVLFMPFAPTKEEQEKLAYSLCHLVEHSHFWCEGVDIEIEISMGISDSSKIILEDEERAKTILADADMALKKAKEEGLRFLFYTDEMDLKTDYTNNIAFAKRLKNAIADDRIVPYFQPIMDIKTGEIKKYEVLMRLIDENGRAIGPLSFLGIAKSSKQYAKLTRIIIQKSFEWFANKPHEFSINISYDDITDQETIAYIEEMLVKYGIGNRVIFEILESEGIKNYEDVKKFVDDVRAYGCRCAIDDFGSGYSSFEHILKLKTDFLKIDGSIIKNIHNDSDAKAVTKAIAYFAENLGIKTVAEFVHSEEVMQTITEIGIDYAQGYLISEPMASTL